MTWPGFGKAAAEMGLHASLSIPLTTGSGATVAALTLYGRDRSAMAPLIAGLAVVCDPSRSLAPDMSPWVGDGGDELLAGVA
jgi:hypothetical protein